MKRKVSSGKDEILFIISSARKGEFYYFLVGVRKSKFYCFFVGAGKAKKLAAQLGLCFKSWAKKLCVYLSPAFAGER